tara:strand:+ start:6117 stop:6467 length:351 start_codon:yes stop_codon:yes gene_type:complete
MIEPFRQFWRQQLTNNERRLGFVQVCGTMLICLGSLFLQVSSNTPDRALTRPHSNRAIEPIIESVPQREMDPLDRLLSRRSLLAMTGIIVIFGGHSLSRWAAFRQGVLSTLDRETE